MTVVDVGDGLNCLQFEFQMLVLVPAVTGARWLAPLGNSQQPLGLHSVTPMLSMYHAVTRQPRRIAALSVGCGILAVSLATRWETRAAFRSVTATASRHNVLGRVTHTSYSVPVLRTAIRFFSTTPSLSGIFDTLSFSSSNMANLTPPQPPPVWTHTPEQVVTLTKEAIKKDREVQDRVAKLLASECNFDTVSTTPILAVAISAHVA